MASLSEMLNSSAKYPFAPIKLARDATFPGWSLSKDKVLLKLFDVTGLFFALRFDVSINMASAPFIRWLKEFLLGIGFLKYSADGVLVSLVFSHNVSTKGQQSFAQWLEKVFRLATTADHDFVVPRFGGTLCAEGNFNSQLVPDPRIDYLFMRLLSLACRFADATDHNPEAFSAYRHARLHHMHVKPEQAPWPRIIGYTDLFEVTAGLVMGESSLYRAEVVGLCTPEYNRHVELILSCSLRVAKGLRVVVPEDSARLFQDNPTLAPPPELAPVAEGAEEPQLVQPRSLASYAAVVSRKREGACVLRRRLHEARSTVAHFDYPVVDSEGSDESSGEISLDITPQCRILHKGGSAAAWAKLKVVHQGGEGDVSAAEDFTDGEKITLKVLTENPAFQCKCTLPPPEFFAIPEASRSVAAVLAVLPSHAAKERISTELYRWPVERLAALFDANTYRVYVSFLYSKLNIDYKEPSVRSPSAPRTPPRQRKGVVESWKEVYSRFDPRRARKTAGVELMDDNSFSPLVASQRRVTPPNRERTPTVSREKARKAVANSEIKTFASKSGASDRLPNVLSFTGTAVILTQEGEQHSVETIRVAALAAILRSALAEQQRIEPEFVIFLDALVGCNFSFPGPGTFPVSWAAWIRDQMDSLETVFPLSEGAEWFVNVKKAPSFGQAVIVRKPGLLSALAKTPVPALCIRAFNSDVVQNFFTRIAVNAVAIRVFSELSIFTRRASCESVRVMRRQVVRRYYGKRADEMRDPELASSLIAVLVSQTTGFPAHIAHALYHDAPAYDVFLMLVHQYAADGLARILKRISPEGTAEILSDVSMLVNIVGNLLGGSARVFAEVLDKAVSETTAASFATTVPYAALALIHPSISSRLLNSLASALKFAAMKGNRPEIHVALLRGIKESASMLFSGVTFDTITVGQTNVEVPSIPDQGPNSDAITTIDTMLVLTFVASLAFRTGVFAPVQTPVILPQIEMEAVNLKIPALAVRRQVLDGSVFPAQCGPTSTNASLGKIKTSSTGSHDVLILPLDLFCTHDTRAHTGKTPTDVVKEAFESPGVVLTLKHKVNLTSRCVRHIKVQHYKTHNDMIVGVVYVSLERDGYYFLINAGARQLPMARPSFTETAFVTFVSSDIGTLTTNSKLPVDAKFGQAVLVENQIAHNFPTSPGHCGSVILSLAKGQECITGVHVGAAEQTLRGRLYVNVALAVSDGVFNDWPKDKTFQHERSVPATNIARAVDVQLAKAGSKIAMAASGARKYVAQDKEVVAYNKFEDLVHVRGCDDLLIKGDFAFAINSRVGKSCDPVIATKWAEKVTAKVRATEEALFGCGWKPAGDLLKSKTPWQILQLFPTHGSIGHEINCLINECSVSPYFKAGDGTTHPRTLKQLVNYVSVLKSAAYDDHPHAQQAADQFIKRFNEVVIREFNALVSYKPHHPFPQTISLKDEPVKQKKLDEGRTRTIISSVPAYISMRKMGSYVKETCGKLVFATLDGALAVENARALKNGQPPIGCFIQGFTPEHIAARMKDWKARGLHIFGSDVSAWEHSVPFTVLRAFCEARFGEAGHAIALNLFGGGCYTYGNVKLSYHKNVRENAGDYELLYARVPSGICETLYLNSVCSAALVETLLELHSEETANGAQLVDIMSAGDDVAAASNQPVDVAKISLLYKRAGVELKQLEKEKDVVFCGMRTDGSRDYSSTIKKMVANIDCLDNRDKFESLLVILKTSGLSKDEVSKLVQGSEFAHYLSKTNYDELLAEVVDIATLPSAMVTPLSEKAGFGKNALVLEANTRLMGFSPPDDKDMRYAQDAAEAARLNLEDDRYRENLASLAMHGDDPRISREVREHELLRGY